MNPYSRAEPYLNRKSRSRKHMTIIILVSRDEDPRYAKWKRVVNGMKDNMDGKNIFATTTGGCEQC